MRTVGINLICIRSNKLSGIGHVAKRYFMEMERFDLSDFHFIIYKQKSVDITIFSIPKNADYEIVNVPDLDGGAGLALFEQTLFYFYLKKCDVMWSPNCSSPWFGRRKKIISILDIYPIVYKNTYGRWKTFWSKVLYKLNIVHCDTIVTISEYSKQDLINVLGVDPGKIKLLYCFLPSLEIEEIRSKQGNRETISIDGKVHHLKKPYFLAVSSIQPIKNYEGLMLAFGLFHKKNPEYNLYVVGGKGWSYEKVFSIVREQGLENAITFTGYISDDDINTLYFNCHATVMPSFYEGFGYTPLEGFYRGKICVATKITSVPEVVGNAGIYVDPYNVESIAEGMEACTGDITKYEKEIPTQIGKFRADFITKQFLDLLRN